MYPKIKFWKNDRGWVLEIRGTLKHDGQFSYNPEEALVMLAKVAEAAIDKKVDVTGR